MPETLLPIVFTASSSSFCRRPVMKTYAPSLTKSFAVANPIPSVPPVMRAILSLSLLDILLLRGTAHHDCCGGTEVTYLASGDEAMFLGHCLLNRWMLMRPVGRTTFPACCDAIAGLRA